MLEAVSIPETYAVGLDLVPCLAQLFDACRYLIDASLSQFFGVVGADSQQSQDAGMLRRRCRALKIDATPPSVGSLRGAFSSLHGQPSALAACHACGSAIQARTSESRQRVQRADSFMGAGNLPACASFQGQEREAPSR